MKGQIEQLLLEQREFNEVKESLEELQQAYKKRVHKTIRLGTDKNPAGGGMFFVNNPFGTHLISALTNKKNGGQLAIGDAD